MHSEGLIKVTKLGTFYSNVFIFEFLMYYVRILQRIFFFFLKHQPEYHFQTEKGVQQSKIEKLNTYNNTEHT